MIGREKNEIDKGRQREREPGRQSQRVGLIVTERRRDRDEQKLRDGETETEMYR